MAAWGQAQVSVLNANYDRQQTGANLLETVLQSNDFDWKNFGKVGTYAVDGQVYAQPLYVPGITIAGKQHNVLYVATMHNSIYAFEADTPEVATPIWRVNFGPAVPSGYYNFDDIVPEIGILGTPVIDPANQVLYAVSHSLPPGALSTPVFQLHAISLVDGHEMLGGPKLVSAAVPGSGAGSLAGSVSFDATQQLQRPGLMLSNGTLLIGFGSHSDTGNYHGWLLGYDASNLNLKTIFNASPNGIKGAIWQSGRAPAINDNAEVYLVTGNGDFDGQTSFGESALHLSATDLSVKDWYTPQEWSDLNGQDWDMGSTGAILIPNTNLLVSGGKAGVLYLIPTDSMGHLGAASTNAVQSVQVNNWGMFDLLLWPQANPIVYEYEPFLSLKAFQIVNNHINPTILSETPAYASIFVGLSLSANGSQGAIVWMTTGDATKDGIPGTLHAFDATNLANELWNSDLAGSRDSLGAFAKFVAPTVANGRVYVPTFSNTVAVYGILGHLPPTTGTISSVVNGASFLHGPISPGELVTIFGANLGPVEQSGPDLEGESISDTSGSTRVLFDGLPAPLLFTSANQINTVVPFGVAGPTSQVQVLYRGNPVAIATKTVQPASPAVFALDGSGGGPGAILNQNGSINSGSNPASRGSVVVLFATGGGVTTPASQDGLLTASPYPAPNLKVSVTIEGVPADVIYAGAAPGLVAGVMQINAVVPDTAWVAPFDQVVVTVGDYVSPSAVTVAVQ
jgi:uncharacterized protein (TIGR03437 family)